MPRAIHEVLWVPPDAEWSADTLDEIGRLVPQSPRPRSHRLRAVHAVLWVPPDAEWNADSLDEIARIVPRGSPNRPAPDEPSLPVMFRVSKDADREVAAVFPTLPGTNDPSTVTVYAHVGQHGSAPWSYVRDRTRPATEAEYAPLLREVRSIYEGGPDPVRLRVVQRATRAMYDERRIAAKAIKTINGRPEKEMLEVKYKLFYIKFDSGWTAISVDSLNHT